MHVWNSLTAWKPPTIQPFLVAVLDFAVLFCRRYDHAFCRCLGMSLFWLSPFWFVAVLTVNLFKHRTKRRVRRPWASSMLAFESLFPVWKLKSAHFRKENFEIFLSKLILKLISNVKGALCFSCLATVFCMCLIGLQSELFLIACMHQFSTKFVQWMLWTQTNEHVTHTI